MDSQQDHSSIRSARAMRNDSVIRSSPIFIVHLTELIALVFTLTTINAWNRLAITMRTEVGKYQPKARPVSKTA